MTEESLCTESDLAQLNILSRSSTEKLKFLDDFFKILQSRITLQDYYIKELNKFVGQLDHLVSQEIFGGVFTVLRTVYNYKLNMEQSFLGVLKEDIAQNLQGLIKRQAGDFEILAAERKQLERDHKHFFERMEMAQKNYFLHGRERDAVALEKESIALSRKQSVQRQNKVSEKEKNMTKIWSNSEASYKAQISDYNTYLNKFGTAVRGINMQLAHHEIERLTYAKEICGKLVDNESGSLFGSTDAIVHCKKSIEAFDVEKEYQGIIKEADGGQTSSLKAELEQYQSYFQKELGEIMGSPDEKEEELAKKFRKFFVEIVKKENSVETYDFTVVDIMPAEQVQELDQRINFISRLVDRTWRGKTVETEELKTFHQMLGERFTRKIFTIAMQQYRICGKFVLSENGFNNIIKVLVHFLYACQNSKDAMSVMKVMILSLTFWKDEINNKQQKKLYLHSKIVWHPVWRDMDFWSTAVFLSIREELKSQKGLEGAESIEETIDREKNIIFGQLLSFSHNMVTFMVEKVEIKKIMEKFVGFYEIDNEKLKLLVNNTDGMIKKQEQALIAEKLGKQEEPKEIKISIISNYFTKKPGASGAEVNESDQNKQMCDNVSKMIEDFKSEYEDENLFMDVYGARGFSFGGETLSATSPEKVNRRGLSYTEEPIMKKPDLRPASTGKKKFTWF